ncbi:MAG TPA: hypothetical protein VHT91_41155 [Kofleriaceae bacterium]|jgi:hypothetical protein|nr:hypothetical protein [Kofleriaceae bacterium]
MKKTTRAHSAKPEPRNRRALRLSYETVRTLNPSDLALAAGGVTVTACDTGSFPTQNDTVNCTKPDSGTGGTPVGH